MSNENVLVTGASSGIGLELARCFAKDGADLVIVARREQKLIEIASQLNREFGVRVEVEPSDLSSQDAADLLKDRLDEHGIEIDVVVNNAGFGAIGTFHETDEKTIMNMMNVNIVSLTRIARIFLPDMVKRDSGGILNVASLAGYQPGPYAAVYYATKSYVLSLSEAIAEELCGTNVRVSCLCPGPVSTEFGKRSGMEEAELFRFGTMSARDVAEQGYSGYRDGRTVVIPGLLPKTVPVLGRFVPRILLRKIASRLNRT